MIDKDKRVAYPLVIRYMALKSRFDAALDDLQARARAKPTAPAPPVLLALVAQLRAEAYRVVSREAFGRPLLRPSAAAPLGCCGAHPDRTAGAARGGRRGPARFCSAVLSAGRRRYRGMVDLWRRLSCPACPRACRPCDDRCVPATHAVLTRHRAGRRWSRGRPAHAWTLTTGPGLVPFAIGALRSQGRHTR